MYQIIGLKRLLAVYAALTAIIAVVILIGWPPKGLVDLWSPISSAGAVAATLLTIFGQSRAFPFLCRWTPLGSVFPDIDGKWEGHISSNWPRVEGRVAEADLFQTPATVRITSRLLHVNMELLSKDRYSTSQSWMVGVQRHSQHGNIQLVYVYKNLTQTPKITDEQYHLGAGCIDLVQSDTIELRGVYWTNRNWTKGLNTAGTIRLKRP